MDVRIVPAKFSLPGHSAPRPPWLDDPGPDYDTEPVMMYANG